MAEQTHYILDTHALPLTKAVSEMSLPEMTAIDVPHAKDNANGHEIVSHGVV